MPRKSSIHFKPLTNIRFAVSHSERTDLSEPAYLLPKEHQLGNIVVAGSLSENDLAALFIKQKEGMTGQAKARASSPFWEGVVVLSNTNSQEQSTNLQAWKNVYEKETGHKVLHMSVHLDEGYLDALGKPQYNPHAHVIVSRMDERNRVISLGRKQLANVQDLTAEQLKMERGSTLDEREGKRGRKHIPHKEFRRQADEKRLELALKESRMSKQRKLSQEWSDADLAKVKNLQAKLDGEPARLDATLKAQEAQLNEQYRLDREEFKRLNAEAAAAGLEKVKSQKDYQDLKKERDDALAKIAQLENRVSELTGYTGKLEAAMVAAGERSQALTDKLARAETEAAKVPDLVDLVKAKDGEIHRVKTKAVEIIGPLREEVKTLKTQITQLETNKAQPAAQAAHLIDTTGVAADPAPRTSQSNPLTPAPVIGPNERARLRALEATKTTLEAPKQVQGVIPSPTPSKTPREAFLELYGHIKTVLVGLIDGMRLDAVEGRLGLFSSHSQIGPRVQVLCEVPLEKAMPVVGQCFDSRARPGKGGIAD